MSTQREESRKEWISRGRIEEIDSGSLQRIADATERMAASYVSLEASRDQYKVLFNGEKRIAERLWRSNAAYRGVVTKLKKRLKRDADVAGKSCPLR